MIRPGTNIENIKESCNRILNKYERACRPTSSGWFEITLFKLFEKPGKEGLQRKENFKKLISELDDNTDNKTADAANAIIKIYDFYYRDKESSRLIKLIKEYLIFVLQIPFEIPMTVNANIYASAIMIQDERLQHAGRILKKTYQSIQREPNAIEMIRLN